MPRKISNSAVYDSTEERRPLAINKRQVRPKPIPIDKASLSLELLNNQTRPVVNIVGTRHFHEDPAPLNKNYPIEIELQRIAMEAVPNKPPFQPLKIKSAVTDEMIEKYREEERRGILQRGYNVPPELLDLEEDTKTERLPRIQQMLQAGEDRKARLLADYKELEAEVKEYKRIVRDNPELSTAYVSEGFADRYRQINRRMQNIQSELATTNEEIAQMIEVQKNFKAEGERVRRANAQKIKNAEDQIRLLNNTLPISQMVGEPDEVYRQRLIALRVPTDNSRVDAQEARVYEHKLFKRNLKKIIELPLYQVENLIKLLDGMMTTEKGEEPAERVFQLNEIWPKVQSEFLKVYGKDPLLRNPEQTLYDFMIQVLSGPLMADAPEAYAQVVEAKAEAKAVETGEIAPELEGLTKTEVLNLIKQAGLSRGQAALFQKKKVLELKRIYTEYLKQPRGLGGLGPSAEEIEYRRNLEAQQALAQAEPKPSRQQTLTSFLTAKKR
jgi:hypothetical protein